MARLNRFEDLECWQSARGLVSSVYDITRAVPLSQDFKLRDQLTSAAVAIMSKIAEGFARYHPKEFIRFLDIAQSSAAELKSLLYVVADLGAASDEVVVNLQRECERCQHLILGLIRYLAKTHRPT